MHLRKQQLELDTEQQIHCLTYTQSIMRNAGVDETQAGIKIARRNTNDFRYSVDTTFMAETEEELKSLLMKEKEEHEKAGLKLSFLRSCHLVLSLHGK